MKTKRNILLGICFVVLSICGVFFAGCEKAIKVTDFEIKLNGDNYQLVDDTITVTYGENYQLDWLDFEITATLDDDSSVKVDVNSVEKYGFELQSDIPTNDKTPVGNYCVTVGHKDFEEKTTYHLVVERADVSFSPDWGQTEFSYDGQEKSISISNLPEYLSATYSGNSGTNAGDDYEATAILSLEDTENYNALPEELATITQEWKINKKVLSDIEMLLLEKNFEKDTTQNKYFATYQVPENDGVVSGEEVCLKVYFCGEGTPSSTAPYGVYFGDWVSAQGTMCAVFDETKTDCNNYTLEGLSSTQKWFGYARIAYEIQVGNDGRGNAFNSFNNLAYYHISTTIPASTSLRYYINNSDENCTFVVLNKDMQEIAYNNGFYLENSQSTPKMEELFVIVSGTGNVNNTTKIYNHKVTINIDGDQTVIFAGHRQTITLPSSPSKEYYTFDGWYNDLLTKFEDISLVASDIVLNAKFTPIPFTITYNNTYNGTNPNQQTYTIEDSFELLDVSGRKGYEFDGWYTSSSFDTEEVTEISRGTTGDITLYADWELITYTITYLDTYGMANTNPTSYTVESGRIPIKDLTSTADKTFLSWGTEIDSLAFGAISSGDTGDLTLYARWKFDEDYTGLIFTYNENTGNMKTTITGVKEEYKSASSLAIPTSATAIANSAFEETAITSINIPDNIESIGVSAFESCFSLASVTFGNGITTIPEKAFYNCGLESITIPSTIKTIGKEAFSYCYLQTITFSEGLETIGENAFKNCNKLKTVTIPNSVTTIGKGVFNDCTSLQSCTFGTGVSSVSQNMFAGCSSLTSVTIPENITKIESGAFQGCEDLEKVVLHDRITTIESEAFMACPRLTEIVMGSGVATIGNDAFRVLGTYNPYVTIYYNGSAEDWAKIQIGENNTKLQTRGTIYYYSDTQPTDEGHYWHRVDGAIVKWGEEQSQ